MLRHSVRKLTFLFAVAVILTACVQMSTAQQKASTGNPKRVAAQAAQKGRVGGFAGGLWHTLGVDSPQESAPVGFRSYTMGHAKIQSPPDRLGGPLKVTVSQTNGSTRFVLPGPRMLDPAVFGTPDNPVGFDPAPFPLLGVPVNYRLTHKSKYTITSHATPFSNWREVGVGSVRMTLVDATAIDGARTKDKIDFEANFKLPDGTPIRVVVKKPIPHGIAFPFFGGVVTNHFLHGVSGIGTRLMPTEFTYAAFWGIGDIYRKGKLVNKNHLVHAMLTEAVRGENYRLLFDSEVGNPPTTRTLHLMVPPFKVVPGKGLALDPLKTKFIPFDYVAKHMKKTLARVKAMPNGPKKARALAVLKQTKKVMGETKKKVQAAVMDGKMFGQPFIHVMFGNLKISASGG
ncbi:MAG: hypothetical protein ACE5JS_15465 [Nitrospinota bacterium]